MKKVKGKAINSLTFSDYQSLKLGIYMEIKIVKSQRMGVVQNQMEALEKF